MPERFVPSLYILQTDFLKDPAVLSAFLPLLSDERLEKIRAFKQQKDAAACAGAGILLSYVLKKAGLSKPFPALFQNEHEKPYLEGTPLHFNLSHSKTAVLCALAQDEIGCDIEDIGTPVMAIAKKRFCPAEYEYLCKISDPAAQARAFYRFWTIKESVLKAVGTGLTLPLNSFCIDLSCDEIHVQAKLPRTDLFYREYSVSDAFRCTCAAFSRADLPTKPILLDRLTPEDIR